jgi:serine/threonine-protein kinase RsbW
MEPGRIEFVHRSWPADPEQLARIRHQLADWLGPLDLTDAETVDVVLAVDEAVSNSVRHAYGPEEQGHVELTLWTEEDAGHTSLYIEVADTGQWRTPADMPALGSGHGIPIMNTTSDAVLIRFGDRGSRVLLRHHLPEIS